MGLLARLFSALGTKLSAPAYAKQATAGAEKLFVSEGRAERRKVPDANEAPSVDDDRRKPPLSFGKRGVSATRHRA